MTDAPKMVSETEALAMVAAALERAARRCEQVAYSGEYPGLTDEIELGCLRCRDAIRAMIPDDAKAALDKMLTEATAQGASDASHGMAVALAEKDAENARLRVENKQMREALDAIDYASRNDFWNCGDIARAALGDAPEREG